MMLNRATRPTLARPQRQTVITRVAAQDVSTGKASYYIASNVFKVKPESCADFEEVWRNRNSYLKECPGFVRFALLKCENIPGKYISQTFWATKDDFVNWTKSSQFTAGHGGSAGNTQGNRPSTMTMLEGPPNLEMFTTVTVTE